MNAMNPYGVPGVGVITTSKEIIKLVEDTFSVTYKQIKSKSRYADVRLPRQVLAYLLVKFGLSTNEAGYLINRDHTTVIHSIKVINNTCDTNKNFKNLIQKLEIRL